MKKIIELISILLFISSMLYAQSNEDLLSRIEAENQAKVFQENNIRAYVDRYYEIIDGKSKDSIQKYDLIQIDSIGNLIQTSIFDKNRKFISLKRNDFNEKNEKIKSYFVLNDRLLYQWDYYYDLSSKLIELKETTELGYLNEKEFFKYNAADKVIKSVLYGPSGVTSSKSEMKYNSENRLIEVTIFKVNNAVEELYAEINLEYENKLLKEIQIKNHKQKTDFYQKISCQNNLPFEIIQNENGKEQLIKREYITFNQETRNIERWLLILDYNKYFKKNEFADQQFKYKVAPQFSGGVEALKDYIQVNIKYPKKAKKEGKEGLVIIGFVIDSEGSVGNIRIHKSVDYELDDAAIELVKNMPKWKPAMNELDKPTISSFKLPINFEIKE